MRARCLVWALSLALWSLAALQQVPAQQTQRCRFGMALCKDGSDCVPLNNLCDGDKDCPDGSDEDDCASACTLGQFQCAHGKMCIERTELCDGVTQCQDRSDEEACFMPDEGCTHRCDKTHCLSQSFICDGDTDCADGSDEANCEVSVPFEEPALQTDVGGFFEEPALQTDVSVPFEEPVLQTDVSVPFEEPVLQTDVSVPFEEPAHEEEEPSPATHPEGTAAPPGPLYCRLGSKPCKDGSDCVLFNHVCDGEDDCKDGSDEEECLLECKAGQFQCAHGKKCIEKRQMCDGVAQCQDRSDEENCFNLDEDCKHRCDKTRCLSELFVCDGDADCTDGSDEANCEEGSCSSTEFRCSSGQCVSVSMRCDGHPDCKDRSDEVSCEREVKCGIRQQRCPESHECVLQEWICDGENDCKDASDEQNCADAAVHCGAFQWPCASQTGCVPQSWRCDGMKDCKDESDETGCEAVPCPPHRFQCGSLECLDLALLCNGATDCLDGSDEGGACVSDTCTERPPCSQDCYSTPTGTRCWCREGYTPADGGAKCVDVDECLQNVCAHTCTNMEGSFQCSCNHGYILEPDGRSCKVTGEAYLLAAVQTELFLLGLRTSSLDVLLSSERQPILSLDYDWKEQRVYWVNVDLEGVRWTTLDQKSRGTLIQGVQAESVAMDWLGRSLYWTDRVGGQINAVRLDSSEMEPVVIIDDVDEPRSLVLQPQKGLMFWCETGTEASIERAGMDGSSRQVLLRHPLRWPVGLALDSLQNRIYWADEKLRCMGSATLDGEDVKILQMMETPSPFSLTVFGDLVYWSDTIRGAIQGAHKVTGKQRQVLMKRPGQPLGLKVIHALLQPSLENPCALKPCSHLCVLAPGPVGVCKCPSPLLLDSDELTCLEPKPKGSSFLLLLSPTAISKVSVQSRFASVGLSDWPEHKRIGLPGMTRASALDLVLREQALYVWDGTETALATFKIKESTVSRRGTLFTLRKGRVVALAVDYITLSTFWSSTDQPGMYVTSVNGSRTAVILKEDVAFVRSIALHPPMARLCFSNTELQGKSALLECASMDGGNRHVVWDEAVNPVSLSLPSEGNRLYWADTGLGLISSVDVDGSGYKMIKTEEPVMAFTLANNLLVWLTKSGSTKCWFSEDQQKATLWFEVQTEVLDVKGFSKQSQKGTNFCSNKNGGCSQLCLAFPGGRTCRCGRGFLLDSETSCIANPRCPPGTVSCLHGDECLPQEMICNGGLDCEDGSDEICEHHGDPDDSKPAASKPKSGSGSKSPSPAGPHRPKSPDNNLNLDSDPNPTTLDMEDVKVESVDAASCGARLCSGNGECLLQDGRTVCQCAAGYKGERCEDQDGGLFQGPVLYGAVGLGIALVVFGAVVGVIQKKRAANQSRQSRPIVRDTSMRDLGKSIESPAHTDPEDPEV